MSASNSRTMTEEDEEIEYWAQRNSDYHDELEEEYLIQHDETFLEQQEIEFRRQQEEELRKQDEEEQRRKREERREKLFREERMGEQAVKLCFKKQWDKVKELILKNPTIMWKGQAYMPNDTRFTIAAAAAKFSNVNMLEFMYNVVMQQEPETQEKTLKHVFEYSTYTPTHAAADSGCIECLDFLIRHCPSGPKILEVKDSEGGTSAWIAARRGHIECLEFILLNAPSGVRLLRVPDSYGILPLFEGSNKVREYFTPQKIQRIALERELLMLQQHQHDQQFEQDSLADIVLRVLQDETQLRQHRT